MNSGRLFALCFLAASCQSTSETPKTEAFSRNFGIGPEAPAQSLPAAYVRPYAQIITERVISFFPHLKSYRGYGLLGNDQIQVILTGADPRGPMELWGELIPAVFERREDRWLRNEALTSISFRRNWQQQPIRKRIMALLPFEDKTSPSAHFELTYQMTGMGTTDGIRLSIGNEPKIFLSNSSTNPNEIKSQLLELKLGHVDASVISRPDTMQLFKNTGIIHVYGLGNLDATIENGFALAKLPFHKQWQTDGVVLAFGPEQATRHEWESWSLEACLKSPPKEQPQSAVLTHLQTCFQSLPKSWIAINPPIAEHHDYRYFSLNDRDEVARAYFYTSSQKPAHVYVTPETKYTLSDLTEGTVWGSAGPIELLPDTSETISLGELSHSNYSVQSPNEAKPSAYIKIKKPTKLTNLTSIGKHTIRSPHQLIPLLNTALIKDWPVQLNLPSGNYDIEIIEEKTGQVLCETSIDRMGETSELECNQSEQLPALATTPNDPASLTFTEEQTGMKLTAYPVDDLVKSRWQSYAKTRPPAEKFSEFVRAHAPEASIQLDCHGANHRASIENIIIRSQPDAIQSFGCENKTHIDKAFFNLAKTGRVEVPRLITPVKLTKEGSTPVTIQGTTKQQSFIANGASVSIDHQEMKTQGKGGNRITASLTIKPMHAHIQPSRIRVFGAFGEHVLTQEIKDYQSVHIDFTINDQPTHIRYEVLSENGMIIATTNYLQLK